MKQKLPIVIFFIPFLILLIGFRLVVFDLEFYQSEFQKYNVYDKFDQATANNALHSLIGYLKSNSYLSEFFNEKEKQHLKDVKKIIDNLILFMYVLLIFVISYLIINHKNLFRILFFGGLFTFGQLIIFSILSFLFFDWIFLKFHYFAFDNNLWILNPSTDNLKALMPDGLFLDALLRILLISSIISLILCFLGFIGTKYYSHLKVTKNR